jgi:hypothetical protein
MAAPTLQPLHEYLIEEDEMGESRAQSHLLHYLVAVLEWLYRPRGWLVVADLTLYHPAIHNSQQMIAPDIAVFRGIPLTEAEQEDLTSWDMRPAKRGKAPGAVKPCPPVFIEVSSAGTWGTDIGQGEEDKPQLYGAMGAREYLAYDPHRKPVWRGQGRRRLLGWRYDAGGQPIPLAPDARGWLWSAQLESWLAPAGKLLRLYDAEGRRRLTGEEARDAAAQEAAVQAEQERRARAEAEAARRDEMAARRVIEERLAALQAALRARNIDLDNL